jgi:hypothetical protein
MTNETQGTVVLAFGPQPMDIFARAIKTCGKSAVVDQDVARMAGAMMACGDRQALDALRAKLESGALDAQRQQTPLLSEAASKWLAHGSRGISSNTMFSVLTGVDALGGRHGSHPHDPDDLDRCLRLLAAVPELRAKLPLMAKQSPEWAALVEHWQAIEQSHLDEVGLGWTKARSAPKTYVLMRSVIEGAPQ